MANTDFPVAVEASPSGFGAVIRHKSLDALVQTPGFLDQIASLVDKHLVIRIVAGPFEPAPLAKLAVQFGVATAGGTRMPGFEPLVDLIFPAKPNATVQDDADMAHVMHHDAASLEAPPAYIVTSIKTNASGGGINSWIDMQAVYRDLPDAMKKRIAGLSAIHPVYREAVNAGTHRDVETLPDDIRKKGPAHPLVMQNHRTGKTSLFLPVRRDAVIAGVSDADARKLLTELWAFVEASPHRWSTEVEANDVMLWENFATVHDRPPFSSRESRQVWLANLKPEKPMALAS